MSAQPVGALATLRFLLERAGCAKGSDAAKAVAAVAKLVEAAERYANATGNDAGLRKQFSPVAVEAARELRAALARMQGGAA